MDLTTAQAAALVKRTRQTIAWWVKQGYLKPVNPGALRGRKHGYRFRQSDVLRANGRDWNKPGRKASA